MAENITAVQEQNADFASLQNALLSAIVPNEDVVAADCSDSGCAPMITVRRTSLLTAGSGHRRPAPFSPHHLTTCRIECTLPFGSLRDPRHPPLWYGTPATRRCATGPRWLLLTILCIVHSRCSSRSQATGLDVEIRAVGGKVRLTTDECGAVDLCEAGAFAVNLREALQSV